MDLKVITIGNPELGSSTVVGIFQEDVLEDAIQTIKTDLSIRNGYNLISERYEFGNYYLKFVSTQNEGGIVVYTGDYILNALNF